MYLYIDVPTIIYAKIYTHPILFYLKIFPQNI